MSALPMSCSEREGVKEEGGERRERERKEREVD
jgi:hypothetical protein